MGLLEQTLEKIEKIESSAFTEVQKRLDMLTKPQGSLGRVEESAARYVAIRGEGSAALKRKVIFTFAGDHGVSDEGVSAFPKDVTPQMVLNFLNGGAAVNVLAKHAGAEVVVVDMGVDYKFENVDKLLDRKIRRGTDNFVKGPAMTRDEAVLSIETGIQIAHEWAEKGVDLMGTGDMGIGNTTPSSAIVSVLTKTLVEEVTGRGTGIDDRAFEKKVATIKAGIHLNQPDSSDPVDVLAKVGGFEIGGIAGLILGAASKRVPVVVDGFISGAAALIACKLDSNVKDYIFLSHMSVERGHKVISREIGQAPLFDLGMRLGEGTGTALCMSLIEASYKILTEMATFGEAGVSDKGGE